MPRYVLKNNIIHQLYSITFQYSGHYRVRTCDLFDVNEARYHCAKCPHRADLILSFLIHKTTRALNALSARLIQVPELEYLALKLLVQIAHYLPCHILAAQAKSNSSGQGYQSHKTRNECLDKRRSNL